MVSDVFDGTFDEAHVGRHPAVQARLLVFVAAERYAVEYTDDDFLLVHQRTATVAL